MDLPLYEMATFTHLACTFKVVKYACILDEYRSSKGSLNQSCSVLRRIIDYKQWVSWRVDGTCAGYYLVYLVAI